MLGLVHADETTLTTMIPTAEDTHRKRRDVTYTHVAKLTSLMEGRNKCKGHKYPKERPKYRVRFGTGFIFGPMSNKSS